MTLKGLETFGPPGGEGGGAEPLRGRRPLFEQGHRLSLSLVEGFFRIGVADEHGVHGSPENVLDLRILRDARPIVAVAFFKGFIDDRQEGELLVQFRVLDGAAPDPAAETELRGLLLNGRAGDPLDVGPGRFLPFQSSANQSKCLYLARPLSMSATTSS